MPRELRARLKAHCRVLRLSDIADLARRADIPMPKVAIVPKPGPNAFATGRDPKHASIAVTRGLLDKLDRTELGQFGEAPEERALRRQV